MKPTFSFGDYRVRAVSEQDRPYLEQLIANDPYHCQRMTPDYFLHLWPGEDAWALEDERGTVILYFRTSTAVRVGIQFANPEDKRQNRLALCEGMEWLEGVLRGNHFHEVLFDTEGPELTQFAQKRLGFVAASVMSRTLLPQPKAPRMPPRAPGSLPAGVEELETTGEREGEAYVRS